MIRKTLRAGALALSLAAISAAQAAPVTYIFTAVVDRVDAYSGAGDNTHADLAGLHVELGDQVTGRFTYDAASASPIPGGTSATEANYNVPTFTLEYTFLSGRNHYASAYPGSATVTDSAANDALIFIQVGETSAQGSALRSLGGLVLGDDTGNFLNSTALPAAIDTAFPRAYSNLVGSYAEIDGNAGFSFGASLTSFQVASVSAVPEPGTSVMLLAGLAALGVAARRRRAA